VYPNKTKVIIGVLLEFIDTAAVVGIGVMLFPILKKHNETIALGYVGTRIIECGLKWQTVTSKHRHLFTQELQAFCIYLWPHSVPSA
ncbi:MAG: DUF4386 domain-containing protein, partial [Methanosarcinales archaeon]